MKHHTHHVSRYLLPALLLLVAVSPLQLAQAAASSDGYNMVEVDAVCSVTRVIDGDTFACIITRLYDDLGDLKPGSEVRVRLADINAPELRPEPEPGALEATSLLSSLLANGTAYLDIDDLYVYDKYGRIIALVLAPYNSTHLVNVNMMLVSRGLAGIWEHDNQWEIADTPLYVPLSIIEAGGSDTMSDDAAPSNESSSDTTLEKEVTGDTGGSTGEPNLGLLAVVILLALVMILSSRR